MKSKKRLCNLYLIFWILYILQDVIGFGASIVSRSLAILVLLISLYYFIYAIRKLTLPKPLKTLSIMLGIWTIYGVLMVVQKKTNGVSTFDYIKNIYISLLPIFTIYVFTIKGWLTEEMLSKWTYVFFFVAIASFYNYSTVRGIDMGTGEFANNLSYEVASLLLLLPLFWKKPTTQYILLGICMLHVILGMKRGAFLISAVCSIWMIVRTFKIERASTKKAFRRQLNRTLLSIVVVVAAVFVLSYLASTSDYFNQRLEQTREGNSSGRDEIYSTLYHAFLSEKDPLRLFFGYGGYASLFIFDSYAHNDWLEIAIDNGLVMLILYAVYWIQLFNLFRKSNKRSNEYVMLGMFLIMFFFRTFVSMSYSDITIYAACAAGYSLAQLQSNKILSKQIE